MIFLPANLQDAGVRFTSDDWNIYAFSAAELVSNISGTVSILGLGGTALSIKM